MLADSGAEVVTVQNGLAAVQEIEKVKRTICEQIALCSQYNRIKKRIDTNMNESCDLQARGTTVYEV